MLSIVLLMSFAASEYTVLGELDVEEFEVLEPLCVPDPLLSFAVAIDIADALFIQSIALDAHLNESCSSSPMFYIQIDLAIQAKTYQMYPSSLIRCPPHHHHLHRQ